MDQPIFGHHWQLDENKVIKPFRRYKAMRNNSMPDLTELSPSHAQQPFIYNKWFIKPEERLKRTPKDLRSSFQLKACNYLSTQLLPYFTSPSTGRTRKRVGQQRRVRRSKQPSGVSALIVKT
jgi:hypothetical protein